MYYASIVAMVNIQMRDVPDEVHRRLKAQAATAGMSLNQFLLERIAEVARLPTLAELLARIQEREPYLGESSAEAIHEERAAR